MAALTAVVLAGALAACDKSAPEPEAQSTEVPEELVSEPMPDLGDIEADRFLAEDRPPSFGRRDHAVDVGVGRSADGDGVGVDREGLIECSGGRNPKFGGNRLCGLGDHVEHADDLGTGNPTVEVLGVHRTDTAAAEYNKTNGHQRVSLSLVEE